MEMVYMSDLKSDADRLAGSNPVEQTIKTIDIKNIKEICELTDSHKLAVIIQLLDKILSELESINTTIDMKD